MSLSSSRLLPISFLHLYHVAPCLLATTPHCWVPLFALRLISQTLVSTSFDLTLPDLCLPCSLSNFLFHSRSKQRKSSLNEYRHHEKDKHGHGLSSSSSKQASTSGKRVGEGRIPKKEAKQHVDEITASGAYKPSEE